MADQARNQRVRVTEGVDGILLQAEEEWQIANAVDRADAALAPGFPRPGDFFEDDPSTGLIAREPRIELERGQTTIWIGRVPYRPPDEGGSPPSIAINRPSTSSQTAIVDAWRQPAKGNLLDFPADASQPGRGQTDADDIGGVPVDNHGEPIQVALSQRVYRFRFQVVQPAPVGLYEERILTRNKGPFGPFPGNQSGGPVLFTSYDVQPATVVHDSVTLEFVVDPWFHMRQTTHFTAEGEVLVWPGVPFEPHFIGNARWVNWHQPFPFVSVFSQLFIGS